ncbi:hypothetical protein [Marinobacter sp.]|uniref:condensin complex protein MksE n=1 Tax=Marinobacter sp. TaxID=50741 RepID=UPI00199E6EB9|nr:hypothetical protein [Marinobacter sp.]MBD3655550.1 hypothetical protein [Marinobacter sp.]
MSSNPLFERAVTVLLEGQVVCEFSHDDIYNYLLLPEHQRKVNSFLGQLNRTLRQTSAHDAWVCAYLDVSDPVAREAVRQQFREVANNLEALVQFLRLVMVLESSERPLLPGEKLSEGAMLERIANVPTLEARLRSLTEKNFFRSKRSDSAGQIRAVMTRLVEAGYLKPLGTSGSLYRATAKWSWLYDAMTYIQSHEGIRSDDAEEDSQMRLH